MADRKKIGASLYETFDRPSLHTTHDATCDRHKTRGTNLEDSK